MKCQGWVKVKDGEKDGKDETEGTRAGAGDADVGGEAVKNKGRKREKGKKGKSGSNVEVVGMSRKERSDGERPGWRRCENVITCKPPKTFDFVEPPSSYVQGKWMVVKN